jgi:magnesium transporter
MFNIPFDKIDSVKTVLDFNKFKQFRQTKYLYFSEATNLLQSDKIETLSPDFSSLLRTKNYWLNIFDPNENDFSILFNSYGVHDLTINDIRERNTEEKMEVYKHYTFFSLRLMCENIKDQKEDVDFNIILFRDFIITVHDKEWSSITDILGFLNLLSTHSHSVLTPDWVLFSCFIEMSQDAKYMLDLIEPEINNIRIESKSVEMSDIMRRNFDMELQVYTISR